MQLFGSTLVALDGSRSSDAALAAACWLAREYGGKLAACHVVALHPILAGRHIHWSAEGGGNERREAASVARRAAQFAADSFGLTLRVEVIDGDPVEEILRVASAIAADAIVIGSRGQSALSTLLLGSVAQGVTETSRLPVLVIHETATIESTAAP